MEVKQADYVVIADDDETVIDSQLDGKLPEVNIIEDEDEEEEVDSDDDVQIVDEIQLKQAAPAIPSYLNSPADDFKGMFQRLLKPIPHYPVKEEAHFVWQIKDWNSLSQDKVRSPTFECGGFSWNILLFPRGNNNSLHLSIYIEPHPIVNALPEDAESEADTIAEDPWYVYAQFGLDLWNPNHPNSHLPSGSSHRFDKNETDWGFASLVDPRELTSPYQRTGKPILENNQLNITAYVRVIDDTETGILGHNLIDYDSKKHTGFVGLNNQGATCYLNSLLQSYFSTKNFRKLVYQIPPTNAEEPVSSNTPSDNPSVALSLQKTFYLLSNSNDPVSTMELTKAFGWDSSDAFTQHDVQELNRILMDKLELAMKGTPIESMLNDVFVGKMKSYIRCVNVAYESSRVEDFWDIQLNVKGFKNLQASFQNYIEIEMLEGENRYQAGEGLGYQIAKKGVVFESFPPVLHLQLKRFEYDFMVDDLVKIDDFYEFPDKIDLAPYLDTDLSSTVKNQNWNYKLHGVLVHQGSISNGHYYAMIKPNAKDSTWLKFDDDKVLKVLPHQVFDENFGANELTQEEYARLNRVEQQENLIRRVTSAYMLVYYRETELDDILPTDESAITAVIPSHIPEQINYEIEERKRIEKARQEALYYTNAKFITIATINNFAGFDLGLDAASAKLFEESLINTPADPLTIKVKRDAPFLHLHEVIGTHLGYFHKDVTLADIKESYSANTLPFRLISTTHRTNHTNRAESTVPDELVDSTVVEVYHKCFNRKYDEMLYYVEELNKEIKHVNQLTTESVISPSDFDFSQVLSKIETVGIEGFEKFHFEPISSTHIVLFVKYFDPVSQKVLGLSHIIVSKDDLIGSIVPHVNRFLNFDPNQKLVVYEELSHSKIEERDQTVTFEKHEFGSGDIITVQVANSEEVAGDGKFKDARDYYRFLLTRMHIDVKPFKLDNEEDSDFVEESQNGVETEITILQNINKAFDLWVSTLYSYQEVAEEIAKRIGNNVDPNYLRLFVVNQGVRHPLKSHHTLSQVFPKTCHVNQIFHFEYSVLNIKLSEFENLKAVRINWLSSILQIQSFELLVPKDGTVSDMVTKLIHKVNIPAKEQKHILVWSGKNHKYKDSIRFENPIELIDETLELYASICPAEVEILAAHNLLNRFDNEPISLDDFDDDFKKEEFVLATKMSKSLNIVPAFHFHKSIGYVHSAPFLLPIYLGETFDVTKERLRKKLGLGIQAFEKIRFALADDNDKGAYLESSNNELVVFDEVGKLSNGISFALDHPDRSPRRHNQFEKGISIK